jgi:hypothetical protein
MPRERPVKKAQKDRLAGKAPSTQAGEFVREEMHHVREGKHGARSPQQAIAIGLSKARRGGVKLGVPRRAAARTRKSARRAAARAGKQPSVTRSRAVRRALRREGRSAASHAALGRQARSAARRRGAAARSRAARKAMRTKGPTGRKAAAQKAARSRRRRTRSS